MRVMFSSNGPWTGTGYGNEAKGIIRGIRDLGYDVACIAWWGLHGGPLEWEGIPMFPGQLDAYGNDAMPHYCRTWHADLLITLIDLWVMDGPRLGNIGGTRWTPYLPIDHAHPVPQAIADRFPFAHRLLVYSKWAETQIAAIENGRWASKLRYIPHGVDCTTISPVSEERRRTIRRRIYPGWPEDAFVCGMVSANKGFPSRKSFFEVFEAFAGFVKAHPNARLYLHSWVGTDFKGPPLDQAVKAFGIADYVRFPHQFKMLGGGFDDELMADIYRSLDVLLSPSQGEGFGLPIVEAQSAGCPVIVTDYSAMSELVGAGWRVPPRHMTMSLLWGQFAEADPQGIRHALEEAIRVPNPYHLREAAREFALQYDWPKVVADYWAPFLLEMDGGRGDLSRHLRELREAAPASR